MGSGSIFDVAVIGAGIAGMSASMYAGRLGLSVAIFGREVGGTITLTDSVENYPGFKSISGMGLANMIKEHAEVSNPIFINEDVSIISRKGKFFMLRAGKKEWVSKSIIFATGTKRKKLNAKREINFDKNGVHYCAVCDGQFYRGKTVAVVGGADSAIKEAIYLSKIAKKVYIIYRGEKIHPEPINFERVKKIKNIRIITKTNILEFLGKEFLEKVKLDKKYSNSFELKLNGVFVEIGQTPMTELAKKFGVKTNKAGEIIVDKMKYIHMQNMLLLSRLLLLLLPA